jgi:hypothetical protein
MLTSIKARLRPLCVIAGALFVLGMAAALATQSAAQEKKADAKKDDAKKAEPKKEAKKPEVKKVPVAKESKIVDVYADTVGGQAEIGYINKMLEKGWKDNKIVHADRCTDYEFIRRASLDIIGRIAKLDEIERFFKDPVERRRSRLIERLLESPDYATNWGNIWTVLLITRTGAPRFPFQVQMQEWLADKLVEKAASTETKGQKWTPDWSKIVTELITAEGETNENGAVNFVLAHLGEQTKEPAANGKYDMVPLTSRTTRLFLGLRTQCVQCHDHPFNGEWLQSHFWGINAFFRQIDPSGRPGMMAKQNKKDEVQRFGVKDNPDLNVKGIVPYERRSGVLLYTDATFLDGKKLPPDTKVKHSTRRAELAKFITTSPYFAKAYVNRMWGHFFGRSFTKDNVDDFGEHNPVSHPELFEKLAEDWSKNYGHDPKVLIRWICNSKAYGLSSAANSTNDKPEDEAYFSRMLLKTMTPEQLFESIMTATEAKAGQKKVTKDDLRAKWMNKLIVNFGDDEGNEGSFNGTVVQALMLMNGADINTAIMDDKAGTAAMVMKQYPPSDAQTAAKAMHVLFKATLNRPPTAKEINKLLDVSTIALRPNMPAPRDPVAFWTGYYQDVFWALLNSNEFILNH